MLRKLFGIAFVVSCAIFPWLVLSPTINLLTSIPVRLGVFCLLAAGGAVLFHQAWPRFSWRAAFFLTTLAFGSVYKLASFIPDVSNYPFSLGWSEASRYYYASLWLSRHVYGQFIPPSVLHPSRYLLQSIPFLISNSPLWLSRIWQVLLWVITASLTSWLLARRLALTRRSTPLIISMSVILWGFLYVFQGPIYYHLLVMVILVLWSYDSQHFWKTLAFVMFTSLWAGISRVNWLPVPGLLAAVLYLMEVKVNGTSIWRYLIPPVVWVVIGTGTAYASQLVYQLWSGNPPAWFGSSFTSDLLWYRLLPNPTFPLGILPSALLVTMPLDGLMVLRLAPRWRDFRMIRLVGLAGILAVLFTGGVVVSVKIGGGSNLHNLDAYLTLLLVIGGYVFFDRMPADRLAQDKEDQPPSTLASRGSYKLSENILIAGALVIPLYFILSTGGQLPVHDYPAAQAELQTINSATQAVAKAGGEVLFISQRQLFTFNEVQNVPMIPEYELVFLMEMAMSGNRSYLDAFHADITSQRFAMIVSEPLVIQYQGRHHSFGEENDAWVSNVSEPVLCYYEPSTTLAGAGVILYIPRQSPCQ